MQSPYKLSNQQILGIWENAQHLHPLDRSLYLIQRVDNHNSWQDLKTLSIGARNHFLLAIRLATFGHELMAAAQCPKCQEELDIIAEPEELGYGKPLPPFNAIYQLQFNEMDIQFKPLTSVDLASICHLHDTEPASRQLLTQSIQSITDSSTQQTISEEAYNEHYDVICETLADAIATVDPVMLNEADVSCPKCQYDWNVCFDLGDFLWQEICHRAKSLLVEVQQLARHYGWSEDEILTMSDIRRHGYIEVIS